ncbi:MAG: prenyltransferase [Halieaceae bacterium]
MTTTPTSSKHRFWQGFWRLADPKISLASFAGLFMAACFAGADAGLHWGWLLLTIAGIFCVEVAKNASGDVVDFDSGTDLAISEHERSPFSGGKRVLVDKLLTREQTWGIAAAFYLAAIAIGLTIVAFRDTRVLLFGIIGMALAWYYHGGMVRLSYRGLGELAVAAAYGPVIVCGAYFVQARYLTAPLIQASMALGILVAAFLWVNQFPDYRADLAAGKKNLVVRLGLNTSALVFAMLLTSGYLWLLVSALYFTEARGMLWGMIGAGPAAFAAWRTLGNQDNISELIPAQAACLASFVLMAAGSGLGYLVFR